MVHTPCPRVGRSIAILAALLVAGLSTGCGAGVEPADLVLLNGKIVTVDADRPEAQALAARDGIIVALGTNEQIREYQGEHTRVLDLQGRLTIPGLIEGHGHFDSFGASLINVDLKSVRTWDEAVDRVATAASQAQPGEWILGRGWHQEKWDARPAQNVEGYPTHESLSRATPHNPVILRHASGHAAIVNAETMRRAGIHEATPDPEGGKILRDLHGRATGVLRETAQGLAQIAYREAQSQLSEAERAERAEREMQLANAGCLQNGITSFQDAGSSFEDVDLMRRMYEDGRISVRLWVMLRESNGRLRARMQRYRLIGAANNHLTVRAFKRSIDGALGSHGAWLLEPYADQPQSFGHNTAALDSLEDLARMAIENDFQLCVHAIGDRGNRETLDLFQRAFESHPEKTDVRWRVEHAQHLSRDDIPRFGKLGVIAAMQGIHCTSDAPWVALRLGAERAEAGAYVWRKLIDSGARICNGTDVPVEDIDPIASFYASVARLTPASERFYPDQSMTRMEALESYTINAAYAAFEDDIKGSLTPGKLADIVVLSQDILTIPEAQIPETQVDVTIIGGQVLYER
jgi:predicted amidohydrolase YtcJ